jgi:hypothetical protein
LQLDATKVVSSKGVVQGENLRVKVTLYSKRKLNLKRQPQEYGKSVIKKGLMPWTRYKLSSSSIAL